MDPEPKNDVWIHAFKGEEGEKYRSVADTGLVLDPKQREKRLLEGKVDIDKKIVQAATDEETLEDELSRLEALMQSRVFSEPHEYFNNSVYEENVKAIAVQQLLARRDLPTRTQELFPWFRKQGVKKALEDQLSAGTVSIEDLYNLALHAKSYGYEQFSVQKLKALVAKNHNAVYHASGRFDPAIQYLGAYYRALVELEDMIDYSFAIQNTDDEVRMFCEFLDQASKTSQDELNGHKEKARKAEAKAASEKPEGMQEYEQPSEQQIRKKVDQRFERPLGRYTPDGKPMAPETFKEMSDFEEVAPNRLQLYPGEMWFEYPPLTIPCPPGLKGRKVSPVDTGGVLKYPQRWCGDKDIFAAKRMSHQAGAVLIDVSGSMSLTDNQVLAILTMLPGAVIATYSGWNHGRPDGKTYNGELRVIAKNGKRAHMDDFRPDGGGNQVDYKAVEWLCLQEGPRIWVTDMGISLCANPNFEGPAMYNVHEEYTYWWTKLSRMCKTHKVEINTSAQELIKQGQAKLHGTRNS